MFDMFDDMFGGWKQWFYDVFIDGFLVGIWDLMVDGVTFFLNFGLSKIASLGSPESMTFQITGLSGWMAEQMNFSACITVVLNAYLLKFLLRKIPFIKW